MKFFTFHNKTIINGVSTYQIKKRVKSEDGESNEVRNIISLGNDIGKPINIPVDEEVIKDNNVYEAFPKMTRKGNKYFTSIIKSLKDSNTVVCRIITHSMKDIGGTFEHLSGTARPLAIAYMNKSADALIAIQHGGAVIINNGEKMILANNNGKLILSNVIQESE